MIGYCSIQFNHKLQQKMHISSEFLQRACSDTA